MQPPCAWRSLAVRVHELEETVEVDRLGHPAGFAEVARPLVRGGIRRDHHDGHASQRRIVPLYGPELPSVHDGHPEIEDDEADLVTAPELRERLGAVRGFHDRISFALEEGRERAAHVLVVLDDEHAFHIAPLAALVVVGSGGAAAGRKTTNSLPRPTPGPTSTPRWMCFASAAGRTASSAPRTTATRSTRVRSNRSRPVAIRDTSSMSSMSRACAWPARSITANARAARSGVSFPWRRTFTHPSMDWSGVRSSWDTVAMNSSFSWFASCACW